MKIANWLILRDVWVYT